tara:strand:+ start:552 stop:1400 length:849 start_codon:yes stop_codon:yes gene_type:complete
MSKKLANEGIAIIKNFLKKNEIQKINKELDIIFSKISNNGSVFYIRANNNLKTVQTPSLIMSINLFELAIKVFKENIEKNSNLKIKDYRLSNIEIFSEKNNYRELFWHTDNRDNILRSTIYLKGGGKTSGAFRYIKNTSDNPLNSNHKINLKNIKDYNNQIIDCNFNTGTLLSFNPIGYHAKYKCIKERRIIFFEFQKKGTDWPKNNYLISTDKLSKQVIKYIDFFRDEDFKITYKKNFAAQYATGNYSMPISNLITLFINRISDIKVYKQYFANFYFRFLK